MDSSKFSNKVEKKKGDLDNIKSTKILKQIFHNVTQKILLKIIKYNKTKQKRLNIDINKYKNFSENLTHIEIILFPDIIGFENFINIPEDDKAFYHIYLNDDETEIINKYNIQRNDKIQKIKILIEHQVKSFSKLFEECRCIKKIFFKKFFRKNIMI